MGFKPVPSSPPSPSLEQLFQTLARIIATLWDVYLIFKTELNDYREFKQFKASQAAKPRESQGAPRPCLKIYDECLDALLPDKSPSVVTIFFALARQLGQEDTIVEMSALELQAATGLSEHTVRKGLNELKTLGLVTRLGENAQRRYVLNEMQIRRCK